MEMTLSVIYISKRENDLEMAVFTKYRKIAKMTIPFPKVGTVLSKNTVVTAPVLAQKVPSVPVLFLKVLRYRYRYSVLVLFDDST